MLKPLAPFVALALVLAGCGGTADADDGLIHVVASTNVYGDIAQTIGPVAEIVAGERGRRSGVGIGLTVASPPTGIHLAAEIWRA